MKYIWANNNHKFGSKTIFRCRLLEKADELIINAGPFYSIYFDSKLVSYGPERTAAGYSRTRRIPINEDVKTIEIIVLYHGVPSLDTDFFDPYFAAKVLYKNRVIKDSNDFKAYESSKYVSESFKYSFQRGFGERFNLKNIQEKELSTFEISPLKEIEGLGDTCKYNRLNFKFTKKFDFKGFDEVRMPQYIYKLDHPEFYSFDPQKDFIDETKNGYICYQYELNKEKSGLINLEIHSKEKDAKIFVVFDEYLDDGRWIYGRLSSNDLLTIDTNEGVFTITTSNVYSLKYLRIIANKEIEVVPSIILIENDLVPDIKITGDEKIDTIIDAARNTFKQNAVDIYTDCPGRERGGWLCDGYFISIAETYFTKRNDIEKRFLENFILGEYEEIEDGMIPMVFPAQESLFIPNWAMWFVLELEKYYKKTNDCLLIQKAKNKVIKLCNYFEKFENEYHLLENLHSWVFIEWSEDTDDSYVEGLSFPTNMLYYAMLKAVYKLYDEEKYLNKAQEVHSNINELSFNGKLYIDNAIRKNGKLHLLENHTSETCQYYAIFFKINENNDYIDFVKNQLGPLRKNKYPEIARSNSFIGFFLRFLWLKTIGDNKRIKEEAVDYLYNMAKKSGTLWEKNVAVSSCNHGFASSIAAFLSDDFIIE